jgi:hypothetical protein
LLKRVIDVIQGKKKTSSKKVEKKLKKGVDKTEIRCYNIKAVRESNKQSDELSECEAESIGP